MQKEREEYMLSTCKTRTVLIWMEVGCIIITWQMQLSKIMQQIFLEE